MFVFRWLSGEYRQQVNIIEPLSFVYIISFNIPCTYDHLKNTSAVAMRQHILIVVKGLKKLFKKCTVCDKSKIWSWIKMIKCTPKHYNLQFLLLFCMIKIFVSGSRTKLYHIKSIQHYQLHKTKFALSI